MSFAADITANYHGGDPNSTAAHNFIASKKTVLQQQILDLLGKCPDGMTSDEVEETLGMSHSTASARLTELHKLKLIARKGRRKTRAGCTAHVNYLKTED